ncbi:MAG TPA: methyl-accepting chemotaxis protein [Stellaceae bacterium]|nr:methyl-accepting chemotaxis protein [Stellaceae bacterium]
MSTLVSNLRLLHKLAIPAAVLVLAGVATVIAAGQWRALLERNITDIVDRDAMRLQLALGIVGELNDATVHQRDARLATTLDDTKKAMNADMKLLGEVRHRLDDLKPMMTAADRAQLLAETSEAFDQFLHANEATLQSKVDSFTTGAAPSQGGEGRKWRARLDELLGRVVDLSAEDMRRAKEGTIAAGRRSELELLLVSGLAQLLALLLLAWIGVAQVSRPLQRISGLMEHLAGGKLEIDVVGTERHDEVGTLARALVVFKQNAISARNLAAEQQAEQRRREQRTAAIETHIRAFEGSVKQALDALAAASQGMRTTSAGMSEIASEGGRQSAAVLAAFEKASANVQTVAGAAEELATSIAEITQQVSNSARTAGKAVDEAKQTNGMVASLSEAAGRIGEVVQLIQDIASQTNLLALNATIEAARAGEAGKGFAVVAHEVKALAGQTAKATDEISTQIRDIQSATERVVGAISTIGGTIDEISEIASSIASAVEEQSSATREISRNTQEAARNTSEVRENIAGLDAVTQQSRSAAEQELGAASALGQQADHLRAEIDKFLGRIRAA